MNHLPSSVEEEVIFKNDYELNVDIPGKLNSMDIMSNLYPWKFNSMDTMSNPFPWKFNSMDIMSNPFPWNKVHINQGY